MRHLLFSFLVLTVLSAAAIAQQSSAAEKYSKANLLIVDGDYREAVKILDQAIDEVSDPKKTGRALRADILLALGKALYYSNDFETAEKRLKKSASVRKEEHSETYVYLGLVSLGMEQTAEATRYLNISIMTNPENGEAWFELGKLLFDEKENERAKISFEKAIELGSTRSKEAKQSLAKIEAGRQESLASKVDL